MPQKAGTKKRENFMERVLQLTYFYPGQAVCRTGNPEFRNKEIIMASAITLTGIDHAISNLKYINENTLKYKYVRYIRQYYVDDNSIAALKEIEHTALIRLLWDTDGDPETFKNKRKNLNSLRSSVNTDLKKLYEKGVNPEGIKIGSDNIFVMSENAKDNILNTFGYDLQPEGKLKLDQIMDILKLANETISDSMVDEDRTKKDDLRKKNQLKDLIKRLSEKLGLGALEFPKKDVDFKGQQSESQGLPDNIDKTADVEIVDGDKVLSEIEDIEEEEVLEEIGDIKEDEILDVIEDVDETNTVLDDTEPDAVDEIMEFEDLNEIETIDEEDQPDDVDEDTLENVEDIVTDDVEDAVMEDIEDSDPEILAVEEEIDEDFEDDTDDEDTELESIDVSKDDGIGDGAEGRPEGDSRIRGNEKENEIEPLGLPIDSLGQEYGSEQDTKLKKDKLLAEVFDGYLGSMDRYYNHYILIDGGEYLIGSRHPKKDERAERTIHLNPFYFGRFPVTNGLFEIFVEKTGYKTTAEKIGYGTVYYGRFEKRKDDQTGLITSTWNSSLYCKVVKGACWYRPSGPESTLHHKRNHPVVQISIEDAAAFAAWTGKRLPTENEWEAASRTERGWIFPWGHEWKSDAGNFEDSGIADTTPVDKYAEFENDFGIVDVLGNVLEWTDSGFNMTSQENDASTCRMAKGGSWVSGNDIRLSSRFKLEPESHSNILGFRCVAY
jgi:formylglycine-generating enzyme required for sulfatase activity